MIYCDTSLLVAALTNEAATAEAKRWLGAQSAGNLCFSGWIDVEISSALAIKVRQGHLTSEQRADVLTHWHGLAADSLVVVPVPTPAWGLAARFTDRRELNLRAGDGLHLAIASLGGHSLATLDLTMADAALAVGIRAENVLAAPR